MLKGTKHKKDFKGTVEERFFRKFIKTDSCWNWIASKDFKGYGGFSAGGKRIPAHRFSFQHFIGQIPPKLLVCHSCDNPGCVNPAHLFLGTTQDNTNDMVAKCRQTTGEKNPGAKLTDSKVLKIRAMAPTYLRKEIAEAYSISLPTLCQIIKGQTWKHLPL